MNILIREQNYVRNAPQNALKDVRTAKIVKDAILAYNLEYNIKEIVYVNKTNLKIKKLFFTYNL
jgi:hypothetical protein